MLRSAGSSEKLLQHFRPSYDRMRGMQRRLLTCVNHPVLVEEVCLAVDVQAVAFGALVVAIQSHDMVPHLHHLVHHPAAFGNGAGRIGCVATSCQMVLCRPTCIVAILLSRNDRRGTIGCQLQQWPQYASVSKRLLPWRRTIRVADNV